MSSRSVFFLKNKYYRHYPLHAPSFLVGRLAGKAIEQAAPSCLRGRLLDIGCGEKWKEELLRPYVSDYTGVDHAQTLHDTTAADRLGSAYKLPAADEEFDSVLCTAVLEHLEEPATALAEAFRVLKPGGCALYTIPFFWYLHEEPRDFYRYTRYGIQHLFAKTGFEVVEIRPLSGFWVTAGSQYNYYLNSVVKPWLKPLTRALIVLNNLVFLFLERLHRDPRWAWMHLVVARKPGPGQGNQIHG